MIDKRNIHGKPILYFYPICNSQLLRAHKSFLTNLGASFFLLKYTPLWDSVTKKQLVSVFDAAEYIIFSIINQIEYAPLKNMCSFGKCVEDELRKLRFLLSFRLDCIPEIYIRIACGFSKMVD